MTKQHPIIPPQELVREWQREANHNEAMFPQVAALAAQWGADRELEACVNWLAKYRGQTLAADLKFVRRPEPPSLKEQAITALENGEIPSGASLTSNEVCIIRRALEALPDD